MRILIRIMRLFKCSKQVRLILKAQDALHAIDNSRYDREWKIDALRVVEQHSEMIRQVNLADNG